MSILLLENGEPFEEEKKLPELPREIWREIGRRNRSRLDLTRFRSVCRTWRSSLPPPIRFPLRTPDPPGPIFRKLLHYRYPISSFVSEVTFYAAAVDDQSSMIVAFEEMYKGGYFSASALLHKRQIHHTKLALPKLSKLSSLTFLCNAYHIHSAFPKNLYKKPLDVNGLDVIGKNKFLCNCDALKVLVISSDCFEVNPNYSRLCDLKVVALCYDRRLAVLSLTGGAMNNKWDTDFPTNSTFEDIISYKGRLYAVNILGEAFVMDYKTLNLTKVASALPDFHPLPYPKKRKVLHLAEVGDNLYMFGHDTEILPDDQRLYRLNLELRRWIEVFQEDLLDHVFVVDARCNFAVSRSLIPRHTQNKGVLITVPRFCALPDFDYVQIAVGFNNTYDPPKRSRKCDFPHISQVCWEDVGPYIPPS